MLGEREHWTDFERALALAGLKDSNAFVQRAAADKERQRNEAEAYRNDIIPRNPPS